MTTPLEALHRSAAAEPDYPRNRCNEEGRKQFGEEIKTLGKNPNFCGVAPRTQNATGWCSARGAAEKTLMRGVGEEGIAVGVRVFIEADRVISGAGKRS